MSLHAINVISFTQILYSSVFFILYGYLNDGKYV